MGRDVRQVRVSHAVTDHHDVHDGKLVVRGHLDDESNVVIGRDEQDVQNTQYIVLVDGQVRGVLDTDGVALRKIIHTGSTFSLDAFEIEGNG